MKQKLDRKQIKLERAAEILKQRSEHAREFEVVSEPEKRLKDFNVMVPESLISGNEYDKALRLEKKLIQEFEGRRLEKVIPGKVVSNEYGDCYRVADESDIRFKKADSEKSRQLILSDLKLIHGIGPARERVLKQYGYETIEDLRKHPIWQQAASEFLKLTDAKEVGSLQNWLWQRLPKSHPLAHYLAGLCKDEDFAIVDIETLGLFGRPIILLGVAKPRKNKIYTNQFLLRDISDEVGALWAFISSLEAGSSFITFNGRGFDIPFIKERLAYYGLEASLDNPHFDVLHFTRRALGSKLDNCRLETVEKYLDIHRDIDIPSALVPEFYETYLRTRNVGPLVAIVKHNKQDLTTLASLFSELYEEWNI